MGSTCLVLMTNPNLVSHHYPGTGIFAFVHKTAFPIHIPELVPILFVIYSITAFLHNNVIKPGIPYYTIFE